MKYSFFKRVRRFLSKALFRVLFAKYFKRFGKDVFIESPDIIEGEGFISLSDRVYIGSMCWLLAIKEDDVEPNLKIGTDSRVGRFSHIVALRNVIIGENVAIADKVYISDNLHGTDDLDVPMANQPIIFKGDVIIGDDCWIGENVTIIGAQIGKGSIISAGAVVSGSIPEYSIVMGNPARVVSNRLKKAKKNV